MMFRTVIPLSNTLVKSSSDFGRLDWKKVFLEIDELLIMQIALSDLNKNCYRSGP